MSVSLPLTLYLKHKQWKMNYSTFTLVSFKGKRDKRKAIGISHFKKRKDIDIMSPLCSLEDTTKISGVPQG